MSQVMFLTLSTLAFFQDFHKNSRSAMRNPANMPPIKTTNTPPTLVTPSAFAFLLFLLSSSLQAPPLFSFHHLVYNFDIFWFSWKNIISLDKYSFHGESVKIGKNNLNRGSYTSDHFIRIFRWRRETGFSPPVKYFTDRSKAVLLMWIFYVFLSCVCYAFVCVCIYVPCGHLLGKG